MLLTDLQVYVLELLEKLRWIKMSQLKKLIRMKFHISDTHLQNSLRQLCYLNRIQIQEEYVLLPQRTKDEQMVAAVDIMLHFANDTQLSFVKGVGSCKLVFFTASDENQKVSVFKVVFVPKGKEALICAELDAVQQPMGCTILFVLEDKSQILLLHTSSGAYFVLKNGDNGYSFYAAK